MNQILIKAAVLVFLPFPPLAHIIMPNTSMAKGVALCTCQI